MFFPRTLSLQGAAPRAVSLCLMFSLLLPGLAHASREGAAKLMESVAAKEKSHDLAGALADCERAVSEDPAYFAPYNERGYLRYALHRDARGARADFDRAIAADPKASGPYSNRATLEMETGDPGRAMADYDRAAALNSMSPSVYFGRGYLKYSRHDLRGALVDLNGAVSLAPGAARALALRGQIKLALGDAAGAGTDVERALALDPKYVPAYSSRAEVRAARGDFAGATGDIDRALALAPRQPSLYRHRGTIAMQTGRWADAVADLRRDDGRNDKRPEYAHIYLWVARAHLGQAEAASQELAAYLARHPVSGWSAQVAGFLLGRVTEGQLLAASASPDHAKALEQQCESAYYTGLKQSLAGNQEAATGDFRRCVATGLTTFSEYRFARAELAASKP